MRVKPFNPHRPNIRPFRVLRFACCVLLVAFFISSCSPQPASIPNTLPTKQALLVLGQNNNLLVVDPPQGNLRQTIQLPIPPGCIVWNLHPAPHGRWLAVELDCDNRPLVETFNVESGESYLVRPVKGSDSQFLAWHSDGASLYVKAALENPRVARVNVEGGAAQFLDLSPYVYDLAVAPDGKQLAYSLTYGIGHGSETYLADSSGSHARLLIRDAANINAFLRWSPRGDSVAFTRMEDSQIPFTVGALVVSDLSGEKIQVLGQADAGHGFAPTWSPDGMQIAFVKRENESDSRADSESSALIANILVVDVSTGAARPGSALTDSQTSQPAWSADGQFIAYTVTSAGTISLWVNDQHLLDDVICCAVWLAER